MEQNMIMVERRSAVPVYAFGAVWLAWAFLLPLYTALHFILAGAVSLGVFLLLNKLIPTSIEYRESPQMPKTGDEQADSLLDEGERYMSQIRAAHGKIKNPQTSASAGRLEQTLGKILAFVGQNPESAPQLRKFMSYYLPTILKLLESYAEFEAQGSGGENIGGSMKRIENILGTINTAMEKQLDALFGDRALDISTDITVLEGMLAQEGLGGQQLKLD